MICHVDSHYKRTSVPKILHSCQRSPACQADCHQPSSSINNAVVSSASEVYSACQSDRIVARWSVPAQSNSPFRE
uniref:Uncharacterized protein n=1 Tax=Caenorhabditis tropicalis TaxID=1561998 RepID=A0A1I7UCS3_9PELO